MIRRPAALVQRSADGAERGTRRERQGTVAFLRANARWLAGGFLLTLLSSFGQTFFIGLSGAPLRARFDLTEGEFGRLYMIATLASAATLPWLGRSLDIMPGWKVARFVVPALAIACLLVAFAPSVVLLGVALYMLRLLGPGMMTHTALTETGRWFAATRGRATSLVVPGYQAGEALFPAAFLLLSAVLGWQGAWVAAAALLLLAGPAIGALWRVERLPHGPATTGVPSARDWTRSEVLRDPVFYLLLSGVLAPSFIANAAYFHQENLIDAGRYGQSAFAVALPITALATLAAALVAGRLIDAFGAVRLLPFLLLPSAAASAGVGMLAPIHGLYLFMLLLGVSNGGTSALLGTLWAEVYGTRELGAIRAMVMSALMIATALGPGITGALIDTGISLPDQMPWLAAWCVAASLGVAGAVPRLRSRRSTPT